MTTRPKKDNSELGHVDVVDAVNMRVDKGTGVNRARREEIRDFLTARFHISQDNAVKASHSHEILMLSIVGDFHYNKVHVCTTAVKARRA